MAYESIDRLKKYMQKKIDAIVTGEKVTFNINAHQLLDEINDMEYKAKAFDEIKEFIIEKLKEEEEETPRTLLSDYDYGLYQAYDNVDDIIQEYLERADDEK